jgi:hypothetical protein
MLPLIITERRGATLDERLKKKQAEWDISAQITVSPISTIEDLGKAFTHIIADLVPLGPNERLEWSAQ